MSAYDISVIVPVYNAEEYLRECIDSLLAQTKKNIEIVLVNDGSTDDSLRIIREYSEKYENVVYIDQINRGVCYARNAGISIARGEYIGWLDSDDMLKPNALESLYNAMREADADYGYYNICFYPKEVGTKTAWYKPYSGKRDWRYIERNSQCTNSLAKKSLLEKLNIQYWFEKYYEYGWIMVLLFSKKTVSLDEELYIYRVGHNSASGGSYVGKVAKFKNAVRMSKDLPEMILGTEYEKDLGDYFQYRYIYSLLLLMIVSSINNDKVSYDEAKIALQEIDFRSNQYTKLILDNNHGKLKSFVLRYILPSNFVIANTITKIIF